MITVDYGLLHVVMGGYWLRVVTCGYRSLRVVTSGYGGYLDNGGLRVEGRAMSSRSFDLLNSMIY